VEFPEALQEDILQGLSFFLSPIFATRKSVLMIQIIVSIAHTVIEVNFKLVKENEM
jgi:hypothetical protein